MNRVWWVLSAAVGLFPSTALALQLTWTQAGTGGNDWLIGETNNVYTVAGVGVDVTITDNNSPAALDGAGGPLGSPGSPSTDAYLSDGGANGGPNLFLKAPGNTVSVVIDIAFSQPLTALSFSIFDFDATGSSGVGNYQDNLVVEGYFGASLIAPTSFGGTGLGTIWTQPDAYTVQAFENADQGDALGTVNIAFNASLDSVRLIYTNDDATAGVQWIGVSHVTFTPVPEPASGLLVSLGLVALAVCRRR